MYVDVCVGAWIARDLEGGRFLTGDRSVHCVISDMCKRFARPSTPCEMITTVVQGHKLILFSSHSHSFSRPPRPNKDFKNYIDLPLARIKRIMKSDEDVHMISAEVLVLFAKACEMFILELTIRAWCYSERSKRRTVRLFFYFPPSLPFLSLCCIFDVYFSPALLTLILPPFLFPPLSQVATRGYPGGHCERRYFGFFGKHRVNVEGERDRLIGEGVADVFYIERGARE